MHPLSSFTNSLPTLIFLTALSTSFYTVLHFSQPPNQENIYLLVSGNTAPNSVTTKSLTSISDGNTLKNYFCKLSDSTVSDNNCSLYSLNTLNSSDKSIQLFSHTLKPSQLEQSPSAISDSSYHILEVDKSLYKTILTKDLSTSSHIVLVDSHNQSKHLGIFTAITPITLSPKESLLDPKISIFLGRISSIYIPPNIPSDNLTCSLSNKQQLPCNIFYLKDKKYTNNLTTSSLSSITPLSLIKDPSPLIKDHYVIVDLLSNRLHTSELKNSPLQISIYDPLNPFNPSNKNILSTIYDQSFIGSINKDNLDLTELFTLTPNKHIYISSKKEDGSSSFLPSALPKYPISYKGKNYRCKFSIEGKPDNFDDSCSIYPIQDFEAKKIFTFNEIIKDIKPSRKVIKHLTSNNLIGEFFNIEFDTNKVYILPQDPLSLNGDISLEISPLENTNQEFSHKLKLLNQITKRQIVGASSLIWAEVISDEDVLEAPIKDVTCAFEGSSEIVNCVIHKTYYSEEHSLIDDLMVNSNHMTITDNFVKGAKYLFKTPLPFNSLGVKGKELNVSIETIDQKIYTVRLRVLNTLGPEFVEGKKLYLFN